MIVDPSQMDWKNAYKLMIGSIVPRPIAFVSTLSVDGVLNLAPFSFFTVVSARPMTVCFCPMRRNDGGKKDTLRNVEETGEFVVNVVSESYAHEMNITSADFPPEVNEFERAGLTPAPSQSIRTPRLAESLVSYECKLLQVVHVGEAQPGGGSLILGTVQRLYVAEQVIEGGRIKLDILQPIGRMAGDHYVRCTDLFAMKRPGS